MSSPIEKHFNSLAEALFILVLGDENSANMAAIHIDKRGLWPQALDVACLWKIIPRLRKLLGKIKMSMPPDQQQRLHALSIDTAARSMLVAHRGATVLKGLLDAGIHSAAFKGVGLSANLYKGAGDRSVGDVDLLINEKDLWRTCYVLRELDFLPQIPIELQEWLDHIKNRIHPTHGYVVFVDSDDVEIDVHWHIGTDASYRLSTAAVIERAEETELLGIPVRAVAPLDAMMLTTHHIIREYFRPGIAVKDLCDLSAWWQVQPERWAIRKAAEWARDWGVSQSLLCLWMILSDSNPDSPAAAGVKALTDISTEAECGQARLLKDLFQLQLREGALDQILVGIAGFNFKTLKRFVSYEIKVKTKRDAFKRLTAQKKESSLPALKRLGRILSAAFRLTPKRLALYRAAVNQRTFFQALYEGNTIVESNKGR